MEFLNSGMSTQQKSWECEETRFLKQNNSKLKDAKKHSLRWQQLLKNKIW